MEAGSQQLTLTHEHRVTIVRGQDLDVRPDRLHARGPDEHPVEGRRVLGDDEIGLEAVDLAAVAVAPHRDVELSEVLLVVAAIEDLVGEQDHPGARAEHRHPLLQSDGDRIVETRRIQQVGHRRRFTARHHEGVDCPQLFGCAYLTAAAPSERRRSTWAANAPWRASTPTRGAFTWGLRSTRVHGPTNLAPTSLDRRSAGVRGLRPSRCRSSVRRAPG